MEYGINFEEFKIKEKDVYRFCFIVDFPMYELSDEGTIDFNHNPFSMPQGGLEVLENKNPLDIVAYQYDLVVDGIELSSGAVRNHDIEIMKKAFDIAGYDEDFDGILASSVVRCLSFNFAKTGFTEKTAKQFGFNTISTTVSKSDKVGYMPDVWKNWQ